MSDLKYKLEVYIKTDPVKRFSLEIDEKQLKSMMEQLKKTSDEKGECKYDDGHTMIWLTAWLANQDPKIEEKYNQ